MINYQYCTPLLSISAFVTFNYQISGSLKSIISYKTVLKSQSITYLLIFEDIIQANLRLSTYERAVQRIIVQVLTILLVLSILLLVSISQITYFTSIVLSLIGINSLPVPLITLLQGILLPILIVLFILYIIPLSLRMII